MSTNNVKQHFQQWALVELMGHQRLAGLVSEADFPAGFVRIDVFESDADGPDGPAEPVFTRIVSPNALYAINPVEKAIAIELARQFKVKPVRAYEMSNLLPSPEPNGPPNGEPNENDDDWGDDDGWGPPL